MGDDVERSATPAWQHVIVAPVEDSADGWISEIRRRHDPLAMTIPAHFTLVYPFDGELDTASLRRHMVTALGDFHEFHVTLDGVSGAEGRYLRYDIKQGNDVLIAMHDQLYSGALARYLNLSESFHPHLTLGRIEDAQHWRTVLGELAASAPRTIVTVGRVISYRRHADGSRQIDNSVSLPAARRS